MRGDKRSRSKNVVQKSAEQLSFSNVNLSARPCGLLAESNGAQKVNYDNFCPFYSLLVRRGSLPFNDTVRVVFIQRSVGPGGSKNSLMQTLRIAETKKDFHFKVLCGDEGSFVTECRENGFEPVISKIPEWRKLVDRFFFARKMGVIAEKIHQFAPDYVISNEMWWAPHADHLAKRLGCKSACVIRDTLAAGGKARKYHLQKLDRVLCISDAMEQELERAATLPGNLRLVYNAILPPGTDSAAETQINKWLKPFSRVRRWLLVIGQIGQRKNQIEAVRILDQLHKAGLKDLGLIFAGEADAGYLPELLEAIAQFELKDFVCLPGQVKSIGNLIERCEATLLTSLREGLPRSIIESFLLDKPCFSTPLAGLEEIYGDEQAYFVSRGHSAAALAPIVLGALNRSEQTRAITTKIRQNVRARFSPENHWRQFISALA